MIRCRSCGKEIRGNAASEDWDSHKKDWTYLCKACDKIFKKAEKLAEKT